MKRILVISNMYPSKYRRTYGIFVKNQVEQLRNKGLHVDTLVIRDPRRGKFHTIKKHLIWMVKILFIFFFKGKKYDIIHAHYVFPSGWPALLFKKVYKTKLIVTSHGGDIDRMAQKGDFILRETGRILKSADQIIAVGEQIKKDISDTFHLSEDTIKVLNMGVNRDIFKPMNKVETKKYLQLSMEKYHLLFVGNLIEAKGLVDLFKAFKILQKKYHNLQLHIIGSVVNKKFKGLLLDLIESEGIYDVFFYEAVAQKPLARWMAAADLFVLPSHIEGFGLVALEAMATHTPVVATRVGGLKYLLADGSGILVESQNPQSLAHGIEEALFNKKKKNLMICRGEQKANEYCQKNIISELINIYEEVINE